MVAAIAVFVVLVSAAPRADAGQAITVDQIAALSHAGVSDAVIIAMIERDQPIFNIEPSDIVLLRQGGLSEAVIVAMLASDSRLPQDVPQAPAAPTVATPAVPVVPYAWVPYVVAVPVTPPCLIIPAPIAPSVPSTRGIFFSQPTAGIFFNRPSVSARPCVGRSRSR